MLTWAGVGGQPTEADTPGAASPGRGVPTSDPTSPDSSGALGGSGGKTIRSRLSTQSTVQKHPRKRSQSFPQTSLKDPPP